MKISCLEWADYTLQDVALCKIMADNKRMEPSDYTFVTVKERPDLLSQIWDVEERTWPEFIAHDAIGDKYWEKLYETFPAYQFALVENSTGRVVANGNSLPLQWEQPLEELPETGWDWVLEKGFLDRQAGGVPNLQSALSIPILPEYRGKGLSRFIVEKMRSVGEEHGLQALIVPVRPSFKSRYPLTPIDHYIHWTNEAGLPFDPWMRVHTRLDAKIVKVCHDSMNIQGTISQWEVWSGLRFFESGDYVIPEALVPVKIDLASNTGTYLEPNVWMVHPCRGI
jgi:GNAT superfamily N-acetyltransferase